MESSESSLNSKNKKNWEIQESDSGIDLEQIYCGRVTEWNKHRAQTSSIANAFKISIYTFCFLLLTGLFWGFFTEDWKPFKLISDCICDIIKSAKS